MIKNEPRGAYGAQRAAALSGVPLSTVYDWSRQKILVPSVSAEKVKLWSWSDLVGLRLIYWLRSVKPTPEGGAVKAVPMHDVRRMLERLDELDLSLWTEGNGGPKIAVDRAGKVFFEAGGGALRPSGQGILDAELLYPLRPFPTMGGAEGPDLVNPRPTLRIVPGKLAGSPHVLMTRVETLSIGALDERGLPEAKIRRLYPQLSHQAIADSIALERQLSRNLSLARAA